METWVSKRPPPNDEKPQSIWDGKIGNRVGIYIFVDKEMLVWRMS